MGSDSRDISVLMECIGYTFKDVSLLERALTHGSAQDRGLESNQRLEFLGDAVLDLVISERLYSRAEEMDEGRMTQSKARVVSGINLQRVAERWGLLAYLHVGKMYSTREDVAPSILADAVEAVIAAVHIDGGVDVVREVILRHFDSDLGQAVEMPEEGDHKSRLSRFFQRRRQSHPVYRCVGVSGPPHKPEFEVAIMTDGVERARAQGNSKQSAEQEAARLLLELLEDS
jgi:ribonuclease-3